MSISMRVTYRTTENKDGKSRLWFASNTKKDLRDILNRHRIRPENMILFEKKIDGVYQEVSLEKIETIIEEVVKDD